MTEQLEHRMTVVELNAREALEIAKTAREDARMALEAWRTRQLTDNELLNKLRETQIEHDQLLKEHSQLLREHSQLLREHSQRIDRLEGEMKAGFGTMSLGMDTIIDLLRNLERS
ncbi:hypothetical protein [Amycolatopsis pithecellobii]|uniref:Uncharacterized protein n=1 Tax=Amycolatopsis pithecellobii TaxID=664692 RepID=A0A6N7Z7T6_9PSEU|nr:hypothetical protein [Amycolatopsis pithecellobii]MTD56166.1 hypothetical protein [Amycolatopsis pithecellobii]